MRGGERESSRSRLCSILGKEGRKAALFRKKVRLGNSPVGTPPGSCEDTVKWRRISSWSTACSNRIGLQRLNQLFSQPANSTNCKTMLTKWTRNTRYSSTPSWRRLFPSTCVRMNSISSVASNIVLLGICTRSSRRDFVGLIIRRLLRLIDIL